MLGSHDDGYAGCTDPDILADLPPEELVDRPWTLGSDHVVWMKAMVEKGMTPMDAIRACTSNVARAYGKDRDYGSVETGKVADLLIVDGDPLAELRNAAKLVAVIKDGVPIDVGRLPDPPLVTRYPRDADFARR